MKNIYWVANSEGETVTLLYRPGKQPTWLSFSFGMSGFVGPVWGGWYPDESEFLEAIRADKLDPGYYILDNPGEYAIRFIDAIFTDSDLRDRLDKDFKGKR